MLYDDRSVILDENGAIIKWSDAHKCYYNSANGNQLDDIMIDSMHEIIVDMSIQSILEWIALINFWP